MIDTTALLASQNLQCDCHLHRVTVAQRDAQQKKKRKIKWLNGWTGDGTLEFYALMASTMGSHHIRWGPSCVFGPKQRRLFFFFSNVCRLISRSGEYKHAYRKWEREFLSRARTTLMVFCSFFFFFYGMCAVLFERRWYRFFAFAFFFWLRRNDDVQVVCAEFVLIVVEL